MRPLLLDSAKPSILCLGAHSDDIEIGAGASLLRLLRQSPQATVHWVVFSASDERRQEARRSADLFAGEQLASFTVHGFRDGFFPASFGAIKEQFRTLQQTVDPDLIFTHWRHDLHQDHRQIAELTGQTFRDHLTIEYEILKYDGDLGSPNLYIPVEAAEADSKVANLLEAFATQHDKYWFTDETFRSLMRVRGVECRSSSGFAEAFYSYKAVLNGREADT
jgi:LmbE family N-acetylglucosaminyl deacetylase